MSAPHRKHLIKSVLIVIGVVVVGAIAIQVGIDNGYITVFHVVAK